MKKLCACQREQLEGIIDAANCEWWTSKNGPYPDPKEQLDEILTKCECKNKKSECDHILGLYDNFGESQCLMTLSRYKSGSIYQDLQEQFYFCPKEDCGAPIDWPSIEQELNIK